MPFVLNKKPWVTIVTIVAIDNLLLNRKDFYCSFTFFSGQTENSGTLTNDNVLQDREKEKERRKAIIIS
jgi:hypothetical protein